MSLSVSLPTQRYYRFGVSAFYFIQGIVFASWANRIPDIQARLNLNDAQLGGVLFALPVGQLTAMMLSGYMVTRFGSKRMMGIAAILYPATLLGLGSVQTVWQLMAALFIFGVFGNLSNIAINTQGVGVERLYRRSIMASFHGLWSLAGFVGGLVAQAVVAADIGPFWHFVCINALTLCIMLAARNLTVPRDATAASKEKNEEGKRKLVKPDGIIVTLGFIAFASMICEGTMFDWSVLYFKKIVHAPKDLARLGYIAFMCTMAGGRFVSDVFVTRFGVSRVLQFSGVTIVTGMLLAVVFPTISAATLGFLLVGIGVSSVVPLAYSLAGKTKRMSPGMALAMVSSIGFLGFLLGPPIIGFVAQASNLRMSFAIVAFLGLGTTMLAKHLDKLITR
ncbi:MAG: MFS transporter [Edaphocola sp.]